MVEAVATTPSRPFAAMCVVVRLDMIPRSSSWISVVAAREGKTTRAVATDFYTPKVVNFPTREYAVNVSFQRRHPARGFGPARDLTWSESAALCYTFFSCVVPSAAHIPKDLMRTFILFAIVIAMSTITLAQILPAPSAITDPKQITSKPNAQVEKSLTT